MSSAPALYRARDREAARLPGVAPSFPAMPLIDPPSRAHARGRLWNL